MGSFRINIAEGLKDVIEAIRDASGDSSLDSIEFSTRVSAEPDLPAIRVECGSAPENAEQGISLYDASIEVTLESSLNEDDSGALHESRLAWLEGVLRQCERLRADWRKPGVTVLRFRIVNYENPPIEGRRADTIELEAAAHPW